MDVFQLVAAPFHADADFDDWFDAATTTNPTFLTVEAAKVAAQQDLNELIASNNEGQEDPEFLTPDEELGWVANEQGVLQAESENSRVSYAIHTLTLG